jgi:hypothetical protein
MLKYAESFECAGFNPIVARSANCDATWERDPSRPCSTPSQRAILTVRRS